MSRNRRRGGKVPGETSGAAYASRMVGIEGLEKGIKESCTAEEVLAICSGRVAELSVSGLATALHRTAKWGAREDETQHDPTWQALVQAVHLKADEFKAIHLAHIAWACARIRVVDVPLLNSISAAAIRHRADFRPQELTNLAWAGSKLAIGDAPLLAAIASAARPRIAAFNSYDLSATAWAFAALGWLDGPLL